MFYWRDSRTAVTWVVMHITVKRVCGTRDGRRDDSTPFDPLGDFLCGRVSYVNHIILIPIHKYARAGVCK